MATNNEENLFTAISQLENKVSKISSDLDIIIKNKDQLRQKIIKLTQYKKELEVAGEDIKMILYAIDNTKFRKFSDTNFSEAAFNTALAAGGILFMAISGTSQLGVKLSIGGAKNSFKEIISGFNKDKKKRSLLLWKCERLKNEINSLIPQLNKNISLGNEYLAQPRQHKRAVRMKLFQKIEENSLVFVVGGLIAIPIVISMLFSPLIGVFFLVLAFLSICFIRYIIITMIERL